MSNAQAATLLQRAVALHQRAQYDAAEDLYRQVLAIDEDQFDAWHLLGVLARQRGEPEFACDLIERALRIDPQQAAAHCNLGATLQDLDLARRALQHYELALILQPAYALAWNNRGNALRKLQYLDEALRSYHMALSCQPDYADAHYNRAIVLHALGDFSSASAGFKQSLTLQPSNADAWCNHGLALQMQQQFEAALISYQQALTLSPRHAVCWCNRGTALRKLRRLEDALYSYDQALEIDPGYADAHRYRGNVLRDLHRNDEAIAAYQQAKVCGGDAEQIHYLLASLGVQAAPQASPAAYVRDLFDDYAEDFDHHLRGVLQYRTPELLTALLNGVISNGGEGGEGGDVIDLGCGTGLCGPLLRRFARTLTGVDLSPRMLEKAAQLAVYDALTSADAVQFLQQQAAAYDVAVAADVLVYIGDLNPLFAALRQALRAGGIFAFSVEGHDGEGYLLQSSRRYAHAASYVREVAAHYGFTIMKQELQSLREEGDTPISGILFAAIRND